jgi:protein phosphatase
VQAYGIAFDVAELSDPGRDPSKQTNEDTSATADTPVGFALVLCDGMGGHENGKLASQTAVRTILGELSSARTDAPPGPALRAAVETAGRAVYEVGGDAPMGLRAGSTCVAVLMHPAGAEVAHVGDSRIYLFRGGELARLTRDHSMVQQMVDMGVLSEVDAQRHPDANRITRALGMQPNVEVELRPNPLRLLTGDLILLCSDGLTDMLEDPEIRDLCGTHLPGGPAVVCQRLIERANERGGHDNITVQILVVREAPEIPLETTLVDAPAPVLPEPRPAPSGGVAPTVVDGEPVRNTEPAVAFRFDSGAPGGGPERVQRGRWLIVVVAFTLLAVLTAVLVRWLLSHRHADDEAIPAPSAEMRAPATLPAASRTVLTPETPPSATASAAPDGSKPE